MYHQPQPGFAANKRPRMEDQGFGGPPGPGFGGPGGYGGYGVPPGPGGGYGQPAYGQGGYGPGPGAPLMGGGYERMFPSVKLRGLPFSVTEDEIREFLECDPTDILMVKRGGRFSGEAFIVLQASHQVDFALQKNKTYMGKRYVEVFRVKKVDYYKAVTQYMVEDDGGRGQPPRGLPYEQQAGPHGGPGGFEEAGPQLREGGPPRPAEREHRAAPAAKSTNPADHTGVLKMRGLPFSATKQDIIGWFSDVANLSGDGIHIVINYEGRPAGVAFVEFETPTEAASAMVKDRAMMGSRYVELFPSSRDEATRTATGSGF